LRACGHALKIAFLSSDADAEPRNGPRERQVRDLRGFRGDLDFCVFLHGSRPTPCAAGRFPLLQYLPHPDAGSGPAAPSRPAALRRLLQRPGLDFLLEAHSGLSAKLGEEAGFQGLWASGLSISASLGLRDSNEASWSQVLDVLEYMADSTRLPILVDGDTGYGNFNNARRLVRKLEQRGLAGVCFEDKRFPKTNSFLNGWRQPLAEVDEFCGLLRAAKDSQADADFVVIARVEAFIAGWGLQEALKRAEAYRQAGADGILIHSARRTPEEVLSFQREWGQRSPVVVVPTKYYTTPTSVLEEAGFSLAIWANQMMRSCITAMQETARRLALERSAIEVEECIAPLGEVFRLQGTQELEEAERRYLPDAAGTRVIIQAATRGDDMLTLTEDRPKCMLEVGGRPLLGRIVEGFRAAGFNDIAVVRGYRKETVTVEGVTYHDCERMQDGHEAAWLASALPALEGDCLIAYGDVLFKKFVPRELAEVEDDFAIFVDSHWQESRNRERQADYVSCSEPLSRAALCNRVTLVDAGEDLDRDAIHGEWMGFLKVSSAGAVTLRALLTNLLADPEQRRGTNMIRLLQRLVREGHAVRVLYTTGNWLDIDSPEDVSAAARFV